jgi:hypothetical protein
MKMETKRIVAGLITIVVFAGLIVCPALARRYDTMMVGYDRWIDNDSSESQCQRTNEVAYYEGDNGEPNDLALYEGQDEPNEIVYYDGEVEPNLVVLLYYPQEDAEHPNDLVIEGGLEPNMAILFEQVAEHPRHPNDVSSDLEDLVLISLQGEHPAEPNNVLADDGLDPNDIEKIILDEGTANRQKEDSALSELS